MAAAKVTTLVTLIVVLAPMACQGFVNIDLICSSGWVRPVETFFGIQVCPSGSDSGPPPDSRPPVSMTGLKVGYYKDSCPTAEATVKEVVKNATDAYPGIGAGLVRLYFHDCFVDGCDGSVLLNTTASGNNTEREGRPNKDSLRGFEVIDAAKEAVEAACPGNIVSCADIVAFAARDAAYYLSNYAIRYYDVPAGRYDGRESFANRTGTLPGPFSGLNTLKAMFAAQGLNTADMVALSGAHSFGQARCRFFSPNRYPAMDPGLVTKLNATCNGTANPDGKVAQDYKTADLLDNQYYKNIDKFVLFTSDAALNSSETMGQVSRYAYDQDLWAAEFADAMVKMGYIGIKNSTAGEIRRTCWKVNGASY